MAYRFSAGGLPTSCKTVSPDYPGSPKSLRVVFLPLAAQNM
jgi:hypothetical protein